MTKDNDGVEVCEGDTLHFAYGIPPVGVEAPVICRDGKLIAITKGHKPGECPVADLRRHVEYFWVERSAKAL